MNVTLKELLIESLRDSDVGKLMSIYPSDIKLVDIKYYINLFSNYEDKFEPTDEMLEYLFDISTNTNNTNNTNNVNQMGELIILTMIHTRSNINRIRRVLIIFDIDPKHLLNNLIKNYRGVIYDQNVISVVLDYYDGRIHLDYLQGQLSGVYTTNYIHNDLMLYIAFRVMNDMELEGASKTTIVLLIRVGITNSIDPTIIEYLLRYLPNDSKLADPYYRDSINKLTKPLSYTSFFEENV